MFNIGDLIIYPGHGICEVCDICDRTINGMTKKYYVIRPIDDTQNLTISTPVENEKTVIFRLMNKEEAEEILELFGSEGATWIDKPQLRIQVYNEILNSGNRKDIAKVANTLMRRQMEVEAEGKKLYENDRKILSTIQNILFKELSIVLNISVETVAEMVNRRINKQSINKM